MKKREKQTVFRESERTGFPFEEGRRTDEIASETGFPVFTNRIAGCDQKLETRKRLAGLT